VSQERLGPSYFFISIVLGPLNSLVWYVPSLGYTRSLDWRIHCGVEVTESSTNKQHVYLNALAATPSSLCDETKRKQIRSRHPVSVIETEEQSRDTHCGYSIETRCVSTSLRKDKESYGPP
jgi:hypothetical protein